MVSSLDELVAHWRTQLQNNRDILDSLEQGRMSMHGADAENPQVRDMTDEAKELQRQIIARLEEAIAAAKAG